MKIIFWISTVLLLIGDYFMLQGFINVYFKNYNGGPESSSGTIVYQLIGLTVLIIAGLVLYFMGYLKWAMILMVSPIIILVLYLFIMLFLPYMMGERMS